MRANSIAILLLGAMALLFAVWLGWLRAPGTEGARVPGRFGAPLTGPPAPGAAGATRAPADEPAAAVHSDPGQGRSEVLVESPPGEELRVIVVNWETREPVPGAEVHLFHGPSGPGSGWVFNSWFETGVLEERLGAPLRRLLADAGGEARIPKPTHYTVVIARHDGLWGFTHVGLESEEPVEVPLRPDFELVVEVVDMDGRPLAGRPVVLRRSTPDWIQDLLHIRTEANGRAILRHAGYRIGSQAKAQGARWSVALAAVIERSVDHALDPAAPPDEPIRLVAPATGELEVRVIDARGGPYGGPITAGLRLLDPHLGPAGFPGRRYRRDLVLPESTGGRALFEHVQPGRAFEVTVARRGSFVLHTASGPGPVVAGERAHIELHLGRDVAIFSGRAVDSSGAPLTDRSLRLRFGSEFPDGGSSSTAMGSTDSEGFFEVDYTPEQGRGARTTLTVRASVADGVLTATRVLPTEVEPGLHELGDVLLEQAPLLAAGIVVDHLGQPIRGALVIPSTRRTWGPERPDSFYWHSLDEPQVRTDALGAFELRGFLDPQPIALAARQPGFHGERLETTVGASSLVLRLAPTGSIAGTVRVDPTESPATLEVLTESLATDGSGTTLRSPRSPVAADGTFLIENLRPGPHVVNIQPAAGGERLASTPDVVVRGGETTRDARLDPIDLRGLLFTLEFEFVDEAGRPIEAGQIRFRPTSVERARWNHVSFRGGAATIFPSSVPIDLMIQAVGRMDTTLEGVRTGRRVVLESGPALRLVLGGGFRPPDPPNYLGVSLTPQREGVTAHPLLLHAEDTFFGPAGELRTRAPATGPVRVDLMLTLRGNNQSRSTTFGAERQVLQVLPGVDLQTFVIEVDVAAYERTLESLRERR